MSSSKKSIVAARTNPRQARSKQMVADIVEAAIHVLKSEGVDRFTTIRVAERAKVSVGSLYRYFPNREALLARIHRAKYTATVEQAEKLVADPQLSPLEGFGKALVSVFPKDEEEAAFRKALRDARELLLRDDPEIRSEKTETQKRAVAFFQKVLPSAGESEVAFMAEFVRTAAHAMVEEVTKRKLSPYESERWATATADMICLFIASARSNHPPRAGD